MVLAAAALVPLLFTVASVFKLAMSVYKPLLVSTKHHETTAPQSTQENLLQLYSSLKNNAAAVTATVHVAANHAHNTDWFKACMKKG
jgi:hypothetical protein